ncbi:response regulator [Chitinophaga ginsengisoli]|uniref:histidine kinase n=1 Tax=Chitinophaga ginsengisoli TaxID=363837 RepID=A0A2P8GDF9_9BACT|nr:response regulator [Chitinophaga ginsengisoli]PSL31925.1 signal transduction histidine kinase [Chitinophaga ginsengisoli]
MKNALKRRLYLGFALALILVTAGGIFSHLTFLHQRTEGQWVDHSYEVITTVQRLNRYIYEIESSGIAYRSTQEKKYLDPYYENNARILPVTEDLRKLVADNITQYRRAGRLETGVIALLNYWQELYQVRDSTYLFANQGMITREEKKYVDSVHNIVGELISEERNLLVDRTASNKSSISRAMNTVFLNNLFILLVAIALMVVSFRELSSRMRIQQELRVKLKDVEELHRITTDKNWLLTGMSKINDSLSGEMQMVVLVKRCLDVMVNYLKIPAGALYSFDEKAGLLKLCAGIALPANVKQEYALEEGITGYAATKKELTVIENVPADYWHIEAGSGSALPGSIVCVPLWHHEALMGMIELVVFGEVSPAMLELLRSSSNAIAVAVNAADARTRIMQLLERVQEQKETLETQQEELRQSNEELTRQSEILQASEEELRVQEEELRQVNDEMGVQNNALEMAREELSEKAKELEQSSRYKSEFLANMSHELRTPLNSVLILARLLEENKDHNLSNKQVEYAGIIHKSGSDLLKLINDILDLSKIEAGKVEMHIEPVSVKSMVSDLEQLFLVMAEEKNIQFTTEIQPGVPEEIRTDKQRLEQVIKNLLSNAFKFTPVAGTIKLSVVSKPDGVHIEVSDSGTGIPAEKQQLIFEAFRQADGSTSRKYGGTGLGLSISKELMKRLDGEIRLQSEEGKGSTFTVVMNPEGLPVPVKAAVAEKTLPVIQETQPIPIPEQPATDTGLIEDDRERLSKQDKLVLIIEDDISFASILRDFARQKGYKTIVALNGNDGLFFARKYLPAAILLDMNLPLIDGNSILKILKSNEDLKHILVHVISAGEISIQVRDKIEGYTQKPLQATDMESVFSGISEQLQARFKKVLVVSDGVLLHHPSLQSLSDKRQLQTQYNHVEGQEAAASELLQKNYDAVILDAGTDIEAGIGKLSMLRQVAGNKGMPIIVYLDHDISEADELKLKKEAAAIVRNSTFSTDRLMDELELFLYKLKEVAPRQTGTIDVSEKSLSGQKVLLADDDMRNLFSITALLEEQGVEVITAADGKEALEKLEQHKDVRLVLMDIMMPEMDGYEAMRRIRADMRHKHLPVIALTAKAMAGDREKCIAAGASDYIAKPIDSSKLLSLIRVWMV